MRSGIYSFILRYSRRDQIFLVLLSLAALPSLYYSFELPKLIVNDALASNTAFPKSLLGIDLGQIEYLVTLCIAFLSLVLINGAFKFFTSTYRYRIGDRLLRRLRYDLVERLLRFPVKEFRNQSSGQIVSMVTAETSSLGLFMSEALTVPTVAIGTLSTILLFIFLQDWKMGVAALSMYPLQMYLIPRIQNTINGLQRSEALAVRRISDNVGNIIANAAEIHGNDTAQYELAKVSKRLQIIFDLRVNISTKRYVVNVLNQFFSQLTPFFFLLIGGYLVIQGDITLGSLVAVLAAHKDMYAPWKDLIDYYQKAADAQVKFEQLQDFFAPEKLLPIEIISAVPSNDRALDSELVIANAVVDEGDGIKPVDGASVRLKLPVHAMFVANVGTTREELARILVRQSALTSGEIRIGDVNLHSQPDSFVGRKMGYVGPNSILDSGSIKDALVYPLLRRPSRTDTHSEFAEEALLTGNSTFDPDDDWIDYAGAGCAGADQLTSRLHEVLVAVQLENDVFGWGIRRPIGTASHEIKERLLSARRTFFDALAQTNMIDAVEIYDESKFLEFATLEENIVFGTRRPSSDDNSMAEYRRFLEITLNETNLQELFLQRGVKIASLMIEMFRDLDPTDDFFQSLSFVRVEELPDLEQSLRRIDTGGYAALQKEERARLVELPLQLISAKHSLGIVDPDFRRAILLARRWYKVNVPTSIRSAIDFFDANNINLAGSTRDNILFGKPIASNLDSTNKVDELLRRVIDRCELTQFLIDLGMTYDVGVGGSRLTVSQRQRLAIARCLLKKPDIVVLNEALTSIDSGFQKPILEALRSELSDRTLIMIEGSDKAATGFQRIFDVAQGRISERVFDRNAVQESVNPVVEDDRDSTLGRTAELLSRIPLFSGIDRGRLKLLAFTSEPVSFGAGQIVFRQGDAGDRAFIILRGEVEVVLHGERGDSVVARLGKNQVFGEMALLADQPRSTTIRASTDTDMLALRQDVFVRVVKENSAVAFGIVRLLIDRLGNTLRGVAKS